jgi:hypothetical protein
MTTTQTMLPLTTGGEQYSMMELASSLLGHHCPDKTQPNVADSSTSSVADPVSAQKAQLRTGSEEIDRTCGIEEEGEEEEDYRKPFLQLFILINCLGSSVLGMIQVGFEGLSFAAAASIVLGLATALLLLISIYRPLASPSSSATSSSSSLNKRGTGLIVGLYAYCGLLNVILTIVVLTDGDERDVYSWFLAIPFLFLHARGVKSCVVALVAVCAQTTLLRYLRHSCGFTAFIQPMAFRHTVLGACSSRKTRHKAHDTRYVS